MKAVVTDRAWQRHIPELGKRLNTEWSLVAAADGVEDLRDADAAIGLALPAEARAAARKLKLFQFPGAGAQHFKPGDLPLGCVLCNVYEHEGPIAEYALCA